MGLDAFGELPAHRKLDAMRMACTYALETWERYAKDGVIEYTDGVVGMHHVVDMQLPMRAIAAVDRHLAGEPVDPTVIWKSYQEPRSAMQDGDLDFPDAIARAYNAIYNLFGLVFKKLTLYDDTTIIRQAHTGDGFLDEWWTRTWDGWASRPVPTYPPSELNAAAFEAIADGDLLAAVAACEPETRVHAVLLALAGHLDEATRVAARVLRCPEDDWLRRNVTNIAPTDALVVMSDGYYAARFENRYVVHTSRITRPAKRCGFTLRRLAWTAVNQVLLAGEAVDAIGSYSTILTGEALDDRYPAPDLELLGTRTIAAVSPDIGILPVSDREIGMLGAAGYQRYGSGGVTGAVIGSTYTVTFAGSSFAVWKAGKCRVAKDLDADIWHAVVAERRVVLALRDAPAHVIHVP